MDMWELWVRERDTLRLVFKAYYSRARAQEEADMWEADGYKVKIYAGNSLAQSIVERENALQQCI